jgi:hypothetical protein
MRKYRILRLARRLLPILRDALATLYWVIKLAGEAANYQCNHISITMLSFGCSMRRWSTYQRQKLSGLALT